MYHANIANVMYLRPHKIDQHLLAFLSSPPSRKWQALSLRTVKPRPARPSLTGGIPEHRNKDVESLAICCMVFTDISIFT